MENDGRNKEEQVTTFITAQINADSKVEIAASNTLDFNTMLQLTMTQALHFLKGFTDIYHKNIDDAHMRAQVKLPKKDGTHAKNDFNAEAAKVNAAYRIYDSFNIAVASILDTYAAGYNLDNHRNDIEEQAIMEVEMKILNERLANLTPEEKLNSEEHYLRVKAHIEKSKEKYERDKSDYGMPEMQVETSTSQSD